MFNSVVPLAKKFISIESIQSRPKALDEILEIALSSLSNYTIEKFEKNGVKSALVYTSSKRPAKFKILLNGHLDTIPGKNYQYLPKIKGGRLYGVGSLDMKASVACLISVFKEVAYKVDYPLGLQLVTDEEVGGFNGTKYQIDKGVRSDFVIAGESTNFNIVNKAKGILWAKIFSKGKTAHGAYPWRGENSIWKMNEFLNLLGKRYPVPTKETWETTINLSRIETTNQAFNKIPDDCDVWLDIRYVPEDSETIDKDIRKLLPQGFKLEIITKEPSLNTREEDHFLNALKKVDEKILKRKILLYSAQGSSDARHFTRVNCTSVEFGPIGGGIGSDDEWVDLESLDTYQKILKYFLTSIS